MSLVLLLQLTVSASDAGLIALPAPVEIRETDDDGSRGEPAEVEAPLDAGLRHTSDLSDEALSRSFLNDIESLGSVSVGVPEAGRLLNGVPMPTDSDLWQVIATEGAYGTQEVIDALIAVSTAVKEQQPLCMPLRINHISGPRGGVLAPHSSHQSGRDVDLGFYYLPGLDPAVIIERRLQSMDLAANWALVKSLVTMADVQMILVDQSVQRRLYKYALKQGEDRAWLDSLFNAGAQSLLHHRASHRDHFHVRFFAGRSQELGRRLVPLISNPPDARWATHLVRAGESLLDLARRYRAAPSAIVRANNLRSAVLRVGLQIKIPLRQPCASCPLPKPVVIPPRRMPPTPTVDVSDEGPATSG